MHRRSPDFSLVSRRSLELSSCGHGAMKREVICCGSALRRNKCKQETQRPAKTEGSPPPPGHQQKPKSKSAVRWDSWSLQPRREQAKQGASRMIFLCQKHSAPDNHWKESDPQGCSGSLSVCGIREAGKGSGFLVSSLKHLHLLFGARHPRPWLEH